MAACFIECIPVLWFSFSKWQNTVFNNIAQPVSTVSFIIKSGNSYATCPRKLFFCRFWATLWVVLWSFHTSFHSHNTLLPPTLPCSNQAFDSELPENICGFHAALGAPGIQLSEVCGLHWDCLETARGPWTPAPPPMPLNQSKPPPSFLLCSAFAFFYIFFPLCCPLLLRVIGVRQTCCVQVCAFVPAFLCADEQMNARASVCSSILILYFPVFHIQRVCNCSLSPRSLAMHLSLIAPFFFTFYFEEWIVYRNTINLFVIVKGATHGS